MREKSLSAAVVAVLVSWMLALLAGLVGAGPAVAVPSDEEMSEKRAGQYYMRAACAHNEAAERFSKVVFGPENAVSFAEIRRRLPEFKRAARALAPATYRWARALVNPPKAWPSSVANPVDTAASKLLRVHDLLRRASTAVSARGYYNALAQVSRLSRSMPTATIRARLDLPPPGRGC